MTLHCGCCEGVQRLTPVSIANPPQLSALKYRVGTHATFFESMKARLSAVPGLTPRQPDDPSIALLDAWAMVADVLTFYQERIANEGYLPTATERRSVLELAALVGYALRPGLAASGHVAFNLEDGFDVEVPAGTRVQSLPDPGEVPQSFETSNALAARAAWNNLRPRQTKPQLIAPNFAGPIYLQGTATNLKPSDPLLLVFEDLGQQEFRRVEAVTVEAPFNRTRVELQKSPTSTELEAAAHAAELALTRRIRAATVRGRTGLLPREVVKILRDALVGLKRRETAPRLTELLTDTVARLRGAEGLKGPGRRSIRELVRDLEAQLARLESPPGKVPVRQPTAPPAFPSALAGFDALLTALAKPPSTLPSSPNVVAQTPADVFATGSDQQAQILAALRPIAGSPYAALANATVTPPSPVKVYALRLTTQLFGHAAPKNRLADGRLIEWPIIEIDSAGVRTKHEEPGVLYLDGIHPEVLPQTWLVVSTRKTPLTIAGTLVAKVIAVDAGLSRADYGISGSVTRVDIDPGDWIQLEKDEPEDEAGDSDSARTLTSDEDVDDEDDFDAIRKTVVYAQSELLARAEAPIAEPVTGDAIELGIVAESLVPGHLLIVGGDRMDVPTTAVRGGELVMLDRVEHSFDGKLPGDRVHSTLHLANALAYEYVRGSTTVYGNVVPATHGETHREILGSGDGSQPSQHFTLRHPYLTYVSARNPKGAASTLTVFVDDVPWSEVEGFAGVGPKAHVYTTSISNEGKTTVTFGDGIRGARLPSGSENVVALYRSGIGKAGGASTGKVSLLATKPLGVKTVVNPLAIAPGADPEGRDSGRRNAPLGVAPLDRLVSVADYEQFALGFSGVGKASARRLWDGRDEVIHVTVTGMDSSPLPSDSSMLESLVEALRLSGDQSQPVLIAPREFLFLVISANVALEAGWGWDSVSAAIRLRLAEEFGFDARDFGQDVASSELISAIQGVAGVAWVQLAILDAISEAITAAQLASLAGSLRLRQRIHVRRARIGSVPGAILPAQLAVVKPELPGTVLLSQVTTA